MTHDGERAEGADGESPGEERRFIRARSLREVRPPRQIEDVPDEGERARRALPECADVEGESTMSYIVDLIKEKPISLTRIARGIPAGGGLESADELTLSAALSGRTKRKRSSDY